MSRVVVLAIAALGLGGYLVYNGGLDRMMGREISGPARIASSVPGSPAEPAKPRPVTSPLSGLDSASLTATVARPLFNPDRLPPPVQPVVQPVEPAPPDELPAPEPVATPSGPGEDDFTLVGISSTSSARIAAIRINASNEVVFVRQGDEVANWPVTEVGARDVRIGGDDGAVVLRLFEHPKDQGAPVADAPEPSPDQPSGALPKSEGDH